MLGAFLCSPTNHTHHRTMCNDLGSVLISVGNLPLCICAGCLSSCLAGAFGLDKSFLTNFQQIPNILPTIGE